MNTLNLSRLTLAITATLATTTAFAAGLDRSGQNTTAFFQDGLYAEAVYTYIDGDVTGYDNAAISDEEKNVKGNKVESIIETYDFFRFGVKDDINDKWSVGVLYDEPWGAAVKYSGENNFVATDADTSINKLTKGLVPNMAAAPTVIPAAVQQIDAGIAKYEAGIAKADAGIAALEAGIAQAEQAGQTDTVAALTKQKDAAMAGKSKAEAEKAGLESKKEKLPLTPFVAKAEGETEGEGTNVEVRSNSLTGILGYKFGENNNFQVYGGPVLQRTQGNIKLRGAAYGGSTGYDAHISPDTSLGWLAGVAYYKPEIALKAALTYRSEIDHEANVDESVPVGKDLGVSSDDAGHIAITTPESINFDFQTGLNQTTLLTANVRYVPWSNFTITPPKYNALTKESTKDDKGLPIANYSDDQWKVDLGLAKRLNDKLAVSGGIGWDSGAGNPTSSLGPVEGYYSAGLGAKYNITDNWAVSAGGKYLWFGDAEAALPNENLVGNFEDNNGFVAAVKLSYQEK
ncbi:outer membrane protein transport protein [Psychrobacter sp. HD31]|uniref:OmpP1/FadL family transporter n=1 Tax=Psychrobacter sp. HD31 TaxID=3112003 RepID=UPI003DA6828C